MKFSLQLSSDHDAMTFKGATCSEVSIAGSTAQTCTAARQKKSCVHRGCGGKSSWVYQGSAGGGPSPQGERSWPVSLTR